MIEQKINQNPTITIQECYNIILDECSQQLKALPPAQ